MLSNEDRLAILGGKPVRTRTWLDWPRVDARMQRNLLDALNSTKWTISGSSERMPSYEQRFGEEFARYIGMQYGVPCSSGTAALTIGLQSLGIQPDDEVIVPGLTWVACASSVCNLGAVPILVDVDPMTLCMDPVAVQQAITTRTRAIMVVHLYSSIADIEAIAEIAQRAGIPILEDCSQAHGAIYKGRRIGSFGTVGAFSLQQSKLLTAGEGGIAVTDDPVLYSRLQQFRADGRRYREKQPSSHRNFYEIEFAGEVLGRNLCMSELQASVVLAGLNLLDEQNQLRHRNFRNLLLLAKEIEDVSFIHTSGQAEQPTFYRLCLRLSPDLLRKITPAQMAATLTAELRLPVDAIDAPLNKHLLYCPLKSPQIRALGASAARFDPSRFELPAATEAYESCVGLPHYCLLGDETDLYDISTALHKVAKTVLSV